MGIDTTKIQQRPVACHSDGLRQKRRGRVAAAWLALGSKQVPGRSIRVSPRGSSRSQVAGPGESPSACRHQLVRLLMSDTFSGRAATEWPALGSKQVERRASPGTVTVEKILLILCFTLSINLPNWKILIEWWGIIAYNCSHVLLTTTLWIYKGYLGQRNVCIFEIYDIQFIEWNGI